MRILVISLLRLGDIVLTAPCLTGLRETYPDSRIELAVNSQFAKITKLLPQVDRVHLFEREELQRGLGETDRPLFEPYDRLDRWLDQVATDEYDLVINLTHTRLSGWLASLIPAKSRIGLVMDVHGKGAFGSNWFRFLNNQVEAESQETFHFSDIFRFALGQSGSPDFGLRETEAGKAEAALIFNRVRGRPVIAVQALTSDEKKDWTSSQWAEALASFARTNPEVALVFLASPDEREKIERLAASIPGSDVAALSFEAAYSFLKGIRLLITGDTSIKHLASAAATPILEIALGSSDPHRTGAYRHGSVIIQSREACSPCIHSLKCHRERHACGQSVKTEAVARIATDLYRNGGGSLRSLANDYRSEIEVFRVENQGGYWAAPSVREAFSERTIARWVDLTCKKIWLSRETARGTEIESLGHLLKAIHPQNSEIEWRLILEDFEKQAKFAESRMNGFRLGLNCLRGDFENPRRMREFVHGLLFFRAGIQASPLLKSFSAAISAVAEDQINSPFARFRRLTELVDEMNQRTQIYLNTIRGLRDELGIRTSPPKGAERA